MDSILVRGREIAERHNQDGDVWSQSQAQKAKKA